MNEFELIAAYFQKQKVHRNDVELPIGDDAAILNCPLQQQLVSTMDTMAQDVHFDQHMPAEAIGYKLAMVNLSDIAAMGGNPTWASLSLGMPAYDEQWLDGFCHGFFTALEKYQVQLIGGDCVKSVLSLTCHMMGFVPIGKALTRSGACDGDIIVVSGYLGDAGRALYLQQRGEVVDPEGLERLQFPEARVILGQALQGIATAAIDISDGLLADCQHILQQSKVGAIIETAKLPLSPVMRREIDLQQAEKLALTAGDDYELCFCLPPQQLPHLNALANQLNITLTSVGTVTREQSLVVLNAAGEKMYFDKIGYCHF